MKIIVSSDFQNEEDFIEMSRYIANLKYSNNIVIEIRFDLITKGNSYIECEKILSNMIEFLRREKIQKELLFTIRTSNEGGALTISEKEYFDLNRKAISSGLFSYIDIEYTRDKIYLKRLIKEARKMHMKSIISHHDFKKTPSFEFILQIIRLMKSINADIIKLAFMSDSLGDVIKLYKASYICRKIYSSDKFVYISMGKYGRASRFFAREFNSCLNYVGYNKTVAPGQLLLSDLEGRKDILE